MGASFAVLACATALAHAGMRVTVVERKGEAGEKLHTTGIIVKDAIDQIALLDGLPAELVHRIHGVRLYAPNLRYVISGHAIADYLNGKSDDPRLVLTFVSRVSSQARLAIFVRSFSERRAFQPDARHQTDAHGCWRYLFSL